MAVSEMKKLSVIAFKRETAGLIASLQKLSCVELTRSAYKSDGGEALTAPDTSGDSARLATEVSLVRKAIEFLMAYDCNKYTLFDAPQSADIDDFDGGSDTAAMALVKEALKLSEEKTRLDAKINEINAAILALTPWCGTGLVLPGDKTAHTISIAGTLPQNSDTAAVEDKLSPLACVLECGGMEQNAKAPKTVYLTALKSDFNEARKILSQAGFSACTVSAAESEGYADGVVLKKREELDACNNRLAELLKSATRAALKIGELKAMHDVLLSRQERVAALSSTVQTGKTVLISGWVPAKAEKKVAELLEKAGAAYSFDEPEEGDDVPVLLDNNKFAANFEPVLTMYALPAYRRFDPTMIMSLFYIIIFGLMFADVGYGAILLTGCLLGLRLMHPKEGLRRMMTMFAICGVACILGGVLFGGYFGDLPNAIMENFGGKKDTASTAVWFDMIAEPMVFLVLSLAVGVVHLVTAMIIKFVILTRDGHLFDAICDVGSWLVLFAGIGVYFLDPTVGAVIAIVGAAMLVLTQGRHEKNIIMKLLKGIMSLYDIVSYASDLLSYSRILALGLASAVIASVVNLLATMGGLTPFGLILFVFVFLIGHVINFLVNILGTYVHTSRLQYIEFFGKFFESGGREFTPLSLQSKYVNLK